MHMQICIERHTYIIDTHTHTHTHTHMDIYIETETERDGRMGEP